jgi:hypothetical protein
MTATARQFLAALASQVGYREGRDPDGNWNNDNKFGRWYGMNFQPWCAMFQSWGADQVGALGTLVPKYASCTSGLNWFRARGQTGVFPPRPGDIFILCEYAPGRYNAQANGWAPIHTGAVERWVSDTGNPDAGFIVTLEGNTNLGGSAQGNGVYRLQRRDSRTSNALIYCRPAWAPEPDITPGGGQSVPIPKPTTSTPTPKPKPFVAPAPYVLPKTQRTIRTKNVRPGKRNEDVRRFNALLWARMSAGYRNTHYKAWMTEPANYFGPVAQRTLLDLYRWMADPRRGADHKNWLPVPSAPVWPGDGIVRVVGGKPV